MRAERLLKILIYLLNHDTATARQLSVYLGVSLRTIQRDMDHLYEAGVPIQATLGNGGGYELFPEKKKNGQFIKKKDVRFLVSLLKDLNLGHEPEELEEIFCKSLVSSSRRQPVVYWEFGVSKEAAQVQKKNSALKDAIEREVEVAFDYTLCAEDASYKQVQPLALRYRWYAWYLFGYDAKEQEFRSFRINKIQNLCVTKSAFFRGEDLEKLLQEEDARFLQACTPVSVWCSKDAIPVVDEYFLVEERTMLADGHQQLLLRVPTEDRLWRGLLLSLGNEIRILSPDFVIEQLRGTAGQMISESGVSLAMDRNSEKLQA